MRVRLGHEDVVEHHLVEIGVAGEIPDRTHLDARRVHRDEELGQAVAAVVGGGGRSAQKRDHVVRAVRVARPDLAPVDLPPAVYRLRPALRGVEVGARVRLAHADAEVALAGHDARQDRVPHRLAAVAHEHRAALPVRDPVRPHRRARRQQLLGDHVALEEAPLAPAVAPGPSHADEPLLAAAPAELRRVAVEPRAETRREGSRVDLAREELAHARPQGLGGLGKGRVLEAGCSGSRRARRTTAAFGTDGGRLSRMWRTDPSAACGI